ncbi:hypothetical protein GYO_1022 [Bacillus spizizenii TU-B-10]|uniref:Uncharacterized protein n=1 Tax=Bacillus spizizenii (strain DSM 15029 / JCM 12233 / NBRC 101239 / NRRL B-23049 / TU-B-10) TaxID=1052585 RepID=G4NUB5_BACS4|nr:hypothetical protein GYO_1022 [Bacillus spizizenii TU-B-10]
MVESTRNMVERKRQTRSAFFILKQFPYLHSTNLQNIFPPIVYLQRYGF